MKKYSPHIDLAHNYWKNHLKKGDFVIDATCGNGNDTLFLSRCVLTETDGIVHAYDIQNKAIENTKLLLKDILTPNQIKRVNFINKSHEDFNINNSKKPSLVVYNLGYLPGHDKTITTKVSSTLKSISNALLLISDSGAISITCYPGHDEGKQEEEKLLNELSLLNHKEWHICYHKWINKINAPSLIWIKRLPLQ